MRALTLPNSDRLGLRELVAVLAFGCLSGCRQPSFDAAFPALAPTLGEPLAACPLTADGLGIWVQIARRADPSPWVAVEVRDESRRWLGAGRFRSTQEEGRLQCWQLRLSSDARSARRLLVRFSDVGDDDAESDVLLTCAVGRYTKSSCEGAR